ncbi:hypothetical protein NSERUTF1_2495 [Nocardia seriolae]|nr:hypothetical protein NSERUTF1_2495 [Nocardia seriolae]
MAGRGTRSGGQGSLLGECRTAAMAAPRWSASPGQPTPSRTAQARARDSPPTIPSSHPPPGIGRIPAPVRRDRSRGSPPPRRPARMSAGERWGAG